MPWRLQPGDKQRRRTVSSSCAYAAMRETRSAPFRCEESSVQCANQAGSELFQSYDGYGA